MRMPTGKKVRELLHDEFYWKSQKMTGASPIKSGISAIAIQRAVSVRSSMDLLKQPEDQGAEGDRGNCNPECRYQTLIHSGMNQAMSASRSTTVSPIMNAASKKLARIWQPEVGAPPKRECKIFGGAFRP